jgi:hypothetical protein
VKIIELCLLLFLGGLIKIKMLDHQETKINVFGGNMKTLKVISKTHEAAFEKGVMGSIEKYKSVWKIYSDNMPQCIKSCYEKCGNADIDGPQGIYWIGKEPKIFFVGKENYEWIGDNEYSKSNTCALPLYFMFYQTAYMKGFWSRIYQISREIFGKKDGEWYERNWFDRIAVSNYCKCYAYGNSSIQWKLYDACRIAGYLFKEVDIVNAKINVFFTKGIGVLSDKFGKGKAVSRNTGIRKYVDGERIYYEMDHPSRLGTNIIQALVGEIKKQ